MSKYFSAGFRTANPIAEKRSSRTIHLILLHIIKSFERLYKSFVNLH
jgi:hypothetical protein